MPADQQNDFYRFACDSCKGLKVRCTPDPEGQTGICTRCAKAGRTCVTSARGRKRGRDAGDLDTRSTRPRNPRSSEANQGRHSTWLGGDDTVCGHSPASEVGILPRTASAILSQGIPNMLRPIHPLPDIPTGRPATDESPIPSVVRDSESADIIDRGFLSEGLAYEIFNRYTADMAPHFPAVVFSQSTTAAELRRTKPNLFLSILSVASGITHHDVQRALTKELMKNYSERIFLGCEKSIELVQALLVSTIWYWPPDRFEHLMFYQLTHIAAVMALEIGLGKKEVPKPRQSGSAPWKLDPEQEFSPQDPESLESRRAWLGCYFLSCNASMMLKRPNLLRWTAFMAECVNELETSSKAYHSDKFLCHMVRNQHLAEEVGESFSKDDPSVAALISDPKVGFALKRFERELSIWSVSIPDEQRTATLKLSELVVNLYMHEIALNSAQDPSRDLHSQTGVPVSYYGAWGQGSLSSSRLAALSTCLTSIEEMLTLFLSLEIDAVIHLPIFHFVRVMYAIVVLISLYMTAAAPNSELDGIIDKNDIRVDYHLDRLLSFFERAAENDNSRRTRKILETLAMLNTWFRAQLKVSGVDADAGPQDCMSTGEQSGIQSCNKSVEHGGTQDAASDMHLPLLSSEDLGTETTPQRFLDGTFEEAVNLTLASDGYMGFFASDGTLGSIDAFPDIFND